jgi:hypothetical protein
MRRNKATRHKALQVEVARRSTNRKVRFLDVIEDNCELNSLALIDQAKRSAAFGQIDWDDAIWQVTDSEAQRGHKQRNSNLCFTQHRREKRTDSRTGDPFTNSARFADLAKAIIRKRKEVGGQCASNQGELIIAFRYLHEELQDCDFDLTRLSKEKLDAAARAVKAREEPGTVYRRVQRLEELARILDENGIVRVKLDWRCSWNTRPKSLRTDLLEDSASPGASPASKGRSKLPSDGIIEAIAYLYHHIPKSAWADRVRVCLVTLLVITGFRIGELLTLPARRVETEDGTGNRYIVYYPEKGAPPQKKWLMTAGGQLAEAIIDELIELTADARVMARWLKENPGQVQLSGLDLTQRTVTLANVREALGLSRKLRATEAFLLTRGLVIHGSGAEAVVITSELIDALRAESYFKPVNIVRNTGEELHLSEALACAFGNAFHSRRAALTYCVRPISEGQLSAFIQHSAGRPGAFERYGLRGPTGDVLRVNSHAFRHWLNDLLDRGGLSDLEQAAYFGRRNPQDNRAYQTKTPAERARKAREDLKAGTLRGPVAQVIARLPVARQDAVLAARVQAVHVVPGGLCFHQFSQTPCPNQMACTDGCGDFHWQTDDALAKRELEFEKAVLEVAVETASREVAEESWGADAWLQHNIRKLKQVNAAIADSAAPLSGSE